jgi:branched-chain amino acid transport system permease protein
MGIRTDRMNALAWAVGGGTVGIAGGLLVNFWYVYPTVGLLFVMIAFASVAMGGFGSIKGAFFAGVLIGMIEMLFPVFGHLIAPIFWDLTFTVVYFGFYFVIVVFRLRTLWMETLRVTTLGFSRPSVSCRLVHGLPPSHNWGRFVCKD